MEFSETAPLIARVKIKYLGPVAPHWDVYGISGDSKAADEFRQRVLARFNMLPVHDPQFRRNRERVIKDAEREGISISWEGVADPSEG